MIVFLSAVISIFCLTVIFKKWKGDDNERL